MGRTARPFDCPWCHSKVTVQPELGCLGWRAVCTRPVFGPSPCRVLGPVRMDPLSAADAWNVVVGALDQAAVPQ